MNADPNAGRQIYELGYLLGEFIVSTWGRPAYLRLIQANGDLQAVLGVSPAAFESAGRPSCDSDIFPDGICAFSSLKTIR